MEPLNADSSSTAGGILRQGRLRQRLSISECSKRTHISSHYLEALEDERWSDLPSESHRLGFLKLYSRFLGVSVDDVIALYHKKSLPAPAANSPAAPAEGTAPEAEPHPVQSAPGWSPSSIPQLVGLGIFTLLVAWLVYHAVVPRVLEQNPMPWSRRRQPHQARLVVPRSSIVNQRVRIKAATDSWLRLTSRNQLCFEGILPAGAVKEWSGPGPFLFKIGNIHAIALFWNDQPVDIQIGAHGIINEVRIPPQ
jgi:transcriptional regulator with XRE-family HTH domain